MSHIVDEHLVYLRDRVRLGLYSSAIKAVVRPGFKVLDLGTGTGVLGLICLRAGAGRLFAVDAGPLLEAAKVVFAAEGLSERVVSIRGLSTAVDLPDRVDVVICDQVGHFGFEAGIVEYLLDARRRFLQPDGTLIPARIVLQVAAVESSECYRPMADWQPDVVGREFQWLRRYAVNTKRAAHLQPTDLVTAPAKLGVIDLHTVDSSLLSWNAALTVSRDATLHGIGGWFECELADGVWMTNSPLAASPIQRPQAFLPLEQPIGVSAGDVLSVTVMSRPAEDVITWTVEVPSARQTLRHSTWQGRLLGPQDLRRASPAHVPRLTRQAEARQIVLGYCDGRTAAGEIRDRVLREHQALFPSADEASRFVSHVLYKDTE